MKDTGPPIKNSGEVVYAKLYANETLIYSGIVKGKPVKIEVKVGRYIFKVNIAHITGAVELAETVLTINPNTETAWNLIASDNSVLLSNPWKVTLGIFSFLITGNTVLDTLNITILALTLCSTLLLVLLVIKSLKEKR